jgi:ABC-type polar amino acid transport system ATPase subunit
MTPVLELEKVEKRFGDVRVLKGVDLKVAAGEVIGVIGPSGAGKSTLLRVVNQLERHQSGNLYVEGERIDPTWSNRRLAKIRSRIGMVFQAFNLWHHLSALENVMLGPVTVLKMSKAEAAERANGLLARVGLAAHGSKFPGQLSGGQQQRVAIARALAMQPLVMLFDEATSALDPHLLGEVLEVMAQLAADRMTMLVVTHEMRFARQVSSRIVFMADGEILEDQPPAAFFDAPHHPMAKAFVRSIIH